MISAFFTKILVALAAILGIVWLCAWLHEKGIRPFASLRKMWLFRGLRKKCLTI